MFFGSIPAIITPFSDKEVDYDALIKIVEFQISNGSNGLVPCGTTGESPTLSHNEHKKIIESKCTLHAAVENNMLIDDSDIVKWEEILILSQIIPDNIEEIKNVVH